MLIFVECGYGFAVGTAVRHRAWIRTWWISEEESVSNRSQPKSLPWQPDGGWSSPPRNNTSFRQCYQCWPDSGCVNLGHAWWHTEMCLTAREEYKHSSRLVWPICTSICKFVHHTTSYLLLYVFFFIGHLWLAVTRSVGVGRQGLTLIANFRQAYPRAPQTTGNWTGQLNWWCILCKEGCTVFSG